MKSSTPGPRCGTYAEYQQHKKRGEVPCDECLAAKRAYELSHRRSQGARPKEPLKPCGTVAAYRRHQDHGEEPCPACLEAGQEAARAYHQANYIPSDRVLQPCGTYAAYRRHLKAGETPCPECAEAKRAYARSRYVPAVEDPERKRKGGRRQGVPVKPCGTYAAYWRHRRKGEPPCEACFQAACDYRAAGPKTDKFVKPCGTYAAYVRHRSKDEIPCDLCQEANKAYRADRRARKAAGQETQRPCGTVTAYKRHVRSGEEPCDACQEAWQRAYHGPKSPRKNNQPCGTYAAYIRHIRAGEEPCGPCQRAHLAYGSRRRALELAATVAVVPPDCIELLLARYGNQCGPVWQPGSGCGKPILAGEETLDHIIPLTRDGLHCMENFQLMHRGCNTRKGNKMPPPEVVAKVLAMVAAAGYS